MPANKAARRSEVDVRGRNIRAERTASGGFTLIEVMVVVIIMAGVATFAISRFNRTNSRIKEAVRHITVLSRDLHNSARIYNRTYRMVFHMDKEQGYAIWVESAPKGILLTKDAFHEDIKKKEEQKKGDEKKPPSQFGMDTQILEIPLAIPSPIFIKDVEIDGFDQPFSAGKAYLYFVTGGLTQEAAIHLTDGKDLNWTIAIHPITGQAQILTELRALKDLRTQ